MNNLRLTATLVGCFTLGVAALPMHAAGDAGVNLHPKLVKGAKSQYLIANTGSRTTTAPQLEKGPVTQDIKQSIVVGVSVVEAGQAGATVEIVYEKIKMDVEDPFMQVKPAFDSEAPAEKDAENMLAPVLRPLVGAKLTLTVGPDGKVTDVKVPEGLSPSGPMGGVVQTFVNPEAVRANFSMLFSVQNDTGSAPVGGTWAHADTQEVFPGTGMTLTLNYKLESAENDEGTVSVSGKAEVLPPAPGEKSQIEIKDSKFGGTITWDTKSGTLRKSDIKRYMKMWFEQQPGQSATVESTATAVVTRLK